MPIIAEEVLLKVRAGWQGEEVQRGLNRLQAQLSSIGRTVNQAFSLLLPTSGLGLVAGLALATRQAIQLSSQFEKMRTGIAAILGSYGDVVDAQGRVLKGAERFNQLLNISRDLMMQIRREADRTILDTRELMEYVQTGLGYGLARGLTPEQVVPLVSRFAVAGRVMGLPQGYPIISEIRALMTGQNLRQSQIAQAVGITEQELRGLRGEQFIRFMEQRLAGFVAASDAFAQSFEARWSTFISKIQEILIDVGDAILPVLGEFAQKASKAIEEWRKSGGVARLQEVVRGILNFVGNVASWIGTLINWLQRNPEIARAIGMVGGGAYIGGRLGGWAGAGIGAGIGGLGWLFGGVRRAWEWNYGRDEGEARLESLLRKATGISAGGGSRAPSAPAVPIVPPRFVARAIPGIADAGAGASREMRQQQALARRVARTQASLRVRQAEARLLSALSEAEEWGFSAEAQQRVRVALREWEQAKLQEAQADAHGEDPRIARATLQEAKIAIAERKREIEERMAEGYRRSLEETRREAVRAVESRWEAQDRIEQARQQRFSEQARALFGTVAYVARTMQKQGARFAEAIATAAELERRRRAFGARIMEMMAGYGQPWQALGVPAMAAGVLRTVMPAMPYGGVVVAATDAMIQAIEDWRERQRRFWQSVRDYIVDSLHDAFVTAGMRLMDNLRNWREAFANLAKAIKDMLVRAILEVVYERVIRAAIERFADWLSSKLGGGSRRRGEALGAAAGTAIGASVGGPVGAVVGGLIGELIGGLFQHGGTAMPRRAYIVGERGPELFVPGTVGTVLSAEAFASAMSRLQSSRSVGAVNVFVNHTSESDLARRIGREVTHALRGAW